MKLNINDTVKAKLTPLGFRVHEEYWKDFYPNGGYTPPKVDEAGYSRFQLWSLFGIFNEHIYMGALDLPFETDLEI